MKKINALLSVGFDLGTMLFFKIPATIIGFLLGGPIQLIVALGGALKGGYAVAAEKATAAVKGNGKDADVVVDAEVVVDPEAVPAGK